MRRAVVPVAIVTAIGALYLLRLDAAAGLSVDDAWYIVLARALQQGEGFRLISSAATPILPAFPPGFPMILAPVLAIAPGFPGNVTALKFVSVVAMAGVGVACYVFMCRDRGAPPRVAAVVAVVTVTMPAFVFLATSTVMAEAAFTLSQLAVVLLIERAAGPSTVPVRMRAVLAAGVLGGLTLLIRLAGIAGIVGGVSYLWWRRGFRPAFAFVAVVALCYLPWGLYSAANRATPEERVAHGGSVAYGYNELLLMRRGGEPSSGRMTLGELPGRVALNLQNVFGRDLGAFVFPAGYRGADESGLEALMLSGETGIRDAGMRGGAAIIWISSAISIVMITGFVGVVRRRVTVAECVVAFTMAMVVLVPARSFRYVLPLAPFLIGYFFLGIEAIAAVVHRRTSRPFGPAFRISALCILLLFAFEHVRYIGYMRAGPLPAWLRDYEEVKSVTDWMNANLVREGPVATSNPGLVYLATGRKTLALMNLPASYLSLQGRGVPYAATLHTEERGFDPLVFPLLHESARLKLWVVELPATEAHADRK